MLEQRHPTLAVTLDGHTGGRQLRGNSLAALVDGVEQDMNDAGCRQAHLVGNSLGGWIALELARRGRAHSVIALSPAGSWEPESVEDRNLRDRLARNDSRVRRLRPVLELAVGWKAARRAALAEMVEHGDRVDGPVARQMIHAAGRFPAAESVLDAMFDGDPGVRGGDVMSPVLLAWGSQDRLLPIATYGERMRRRLPQAD
jgi:pimeloyl-ACP methyl ester carboxylesterase